VQEIQSAFRGLAMKWRKSFLETYNHSHLLLTIQLISLPELDPDRLNTPEEKAKGKKKFQEITAAYSVLRDPKKRRAYDFYGQT
jgi:DnaJ-class molecular chaperone